MLPPNDRADAPFLASSRLHTHVADVGLGSRYNENDHTIIITVTVTKPADVI